MNVEGSRMREIRTSGLTRGRWPVRLARRAGVYSTSWAGPRRAGLWAVDEVDRDLCDARDG